MVKFIDRKEKFLLLGDATTAVLFLSDLEVGCYYGDPASRGKKDSFIFIFLIMDFLKVNMETAFLMYRI